MKIEEAYQLVVNTINDLRSAACDINVRPSSNQFNEAVVLENSGPDKLPVNLWSVVNITVKHPDKEQEGKLFEKVLAAEKKLVGLGISFPVTPKIGDEEGSMVTWYLDEDFSCKEPERVEKKIELIPDPMNPPRDILVKLGLIILYLEEKCHARGNWASQHALDAMRNDPVVIEWMDKVVGREILPKPQQQ